MNCGKGEVVSGHDIRRDDGCMGEGHPGLGDRGEWPVSQVLTKIDKEEKEKKEKNILSRIRMSDEELEDEVMRLSELIRYQLFVGALKGNISQFFNIFRASMKVCPWEPIPGAKSIFEVDSQPVIGPALLNL
jgi:hypothetical protein